MVSSRVLAVLAALALVACGQSEAESPPPPREAPSMTVEIQQHRRDQVVDVVRVAVHNTGTTPLVVESYRAELPGFAGSAPVVDESRIGPGLVVTLPWAYGEISCPFDAALSASGQVRLRVREGDAGTAREVALPAADPRGLLADIGRRACALEKLAGEVDLRFGDDWTLERSPSGDVVRGTLEARLLRGPAKVVTDVRGAILYGLRAERPRQPLAELTPDDPAASIPVVAYAARCDGHTIGEIKKPYEFLVWVGEGDGEPLATTPEVGAATKKALRRVCAF
jgi:hypothetical protein